MEYRVYHSTSSSAGRARGGIGADVPHAGPDVKFRESFENICQRSSIEILYP
jgi:hypothetical protein